LSVINLHRLNVDLLQLFKLHVDISVAFALHIGVCYKKIRIIYSVQTDHSVLTTHVDTHTHLFNSPFSGTTQVGRYQKGKTNLDFTEARDSEWQWN